MSRQLMILSLHVVFCVIFQSVKEILNFMDPIDQVNAYNQPVVGPDPAGILKRPNIKSATMNHHCTEVI
jgi:hypothetical protein